MGGFGQLWIGLRFPLHTRPNKVAFVVQPLVFVVSMHPGQDVWCCGVSLLGSQLRAVMQPTPGNTFPALSVLYLNVSSELSTSTLPPPSLKENLFQGWLSPRQIDCMFPGIHFGPHPFWPFLASCIELLISKPIMWHQECCQYWQFNPSRVWRLFYHILGSCHLSDWFHGEILHDLSRVLFWREH